MEIRGRNWRRTCLSIVLVAVCFLTSLSFLSINARAETVIRTGKVTASSLHLRADAGAECAHITYLYNGDVGTILDEKAASTGTIWYKMDINGYIGWASSSYIDVTVTVLKEDADFDTYLATQGFPESYRPQLQALHALYPNWVFEAQITNLNWADVIAAESKVGVNTVHDSSSPASWKSTEEGAYNWSTGEWIEIDSGGWISASKEIIQYYMDPRNFLDNTNIFQFIKQSYNASALNSTQLAQKKSELTSMVSGTYLAGECEGRPYVDILMDIGRDTGVCPLMLASMMIQEQGRDGSGRSISGTVEGYEGYYNYLNIGAYKTSEFSSAVVRGLWYAKGSGKDSTTYGRPWNTRVKAMTGGALYYGENFVKVGQDTLYLKKFNVQGKNPYGHQYMTNVGGAASEGKHVADGYDENARKSALVFKIPVYNDMPSTACVKPTGDDNPNYMLKSLAVAGYNLTPSFSMYDTSYSLIVPNHVTSVTVSASAAATSTTVSGTGVKNLNVGSNIVSVTTKAQSGVTREYTISIVRLEEGQAEVPTPSTPSTVPTPNVSTPSYRIKNSTVSGITGFPVNVSTFTSKFAVSNGTVKITTANGASKSGNVGTGDQVRVYDSSGALKLLYNVVIYGDTNGDGKVTALDLLRVQKHILKLDGYQLSNLYGSAADTSKDGKVNALDLLQVQKQILGIKNIQQ